MEKMPTQIYKSECPSDEKIEEVLQGIKVGDILYSYDKYCLIQDVEKISEYINPSSHEKSCTISLCVLWLTPSAMGLNATLDLDLRNRSFWEIKA
jgi:hypothetical protein